MRVKGLSAAKDDQVCSLPSSAPAGVVVVSILIKSVLFSLTVH